MKRILVAGMLAMALAVPAYAVEGGQPPPPKDQGANFEQRKADILGNMDRRMNRLQEEKACVEAAKNMDDLKACREKFMPEGMRRRGEGRKDNRERPEGMREKGGEGAEGGAAPPPPHGQ